MLRYTTLILLIGTLASQTSFADIISTFDTGSEGWTANGGSLTWVSAGGSPGGFISVADNASNFMTVIAPTAFTGDLSAYLLGRVSFDAKNLNGSAPDLVRGSFGTVTITGSAATASRVLGGPNQPPADDAWHSYSAFLDPADWTGDLTLALANVSAITVELESNETVPAEINGFDNFRVSAIPEPSSALLLLTAGGVACLVRRRGRTKR